MNDTIIDQERRKFLVHGTVALAAAGVATTAVPFLTSWRPTVATALSGLPLRIDLS